MSLVTSGVGLHGQEVGDEEDDTLLGAQLKGEDPGELLLVVNKDKEKSALASLEGLPFLDEDGSGTGESEPLQGLPLDGEELGGLPRVNQGKVGGSEDDNSGLGLIDGRRHPVANGSGIGDEEDGMLTGPVLGPPGKGEEVVSELSIDPNEGKGDDRMSLGTCPSVRVQL